MNNTEEITQLSLGQFNSLLVIPDRFYIYETIKLVLSNRISNALFLGCNPFIKPCLIRIIRLS